MFFVSEDSEEFTIHCWLDLDFPLEFDIVVPFLASCVPFSRVVWVPILSILGGLELEGINLSVLVAAAAISSSHERHL